MLQKVLPFVSGLHFEIIGSWPLRLAFDLVPPVEDFAHLEGPFFPSKSARCLIRLGSGVAFDFNRNQFHQPETGPFSSSARSTTCACCTWAAITCRARLNHFWQRSRMA